AWGGVAGRGRAWCVRVWVARAQVGQGGRVGPALVTEVLRIAGEVVALALQLGAQLLGIEHGGPPPQRPRIRRSSVCNSAELRRTEWPDLDLEEAAPGGGVVGVID